MPVFCKAKYANTACRKRNAQTVTIKTIHWHIYKLYCYVIIFINLFIGTWSTRSRIPIRLFSFENLWLCRIPFSWITMWPRQFPNMACKRSLTTVHKLPLCWNIQLQRIGDSWALIKRLKDYSPKPPYAKQNKYLGVLLLKVVLDLSIEFWKLSYVKDPPPESLLLKRKVYFNSLSALPLFICLQKNRRCA